MHPIAMAMKRTASITSFFSPLAKRTAQEERTQDDNSLSYPETELTSKDTDQQSTLDIADFVVAASTVPDQVKYRIIKERRPPLNVSIPNKVYKDSNRKGGTYQRRCNRQWFDIFDFLAYSRSAEGLFCLACVLFPTSGAHEGVSRAQYLVTKPYQNWKDGKADLMAHAHLHYHLGAEARLRAFVSTMENPSLRVDLVVADESQKLVKRNRSVLTSIIKCLEMCGRQGIALRGHRDDSTSDDVNKGKFRALVDFRIESGDTVLKDFLEKQCAKNATYMSKTSQNDLLECMGNNILTKILVDLKTNKFFGLEADEVADTSGWEQLGLALRYVKDNKPVERLVGFFACENVTGTSICATIIEALANFGLDAAFCRAQAYDGAGCMSGHLNGCQAKFQESFPKATYYHCSSHQLNLALSKACMVSSIQSMLSDLKAVGIFFKYSPKRQRRLEEAVKDVNARRNDEGHPPLSSFKAKMMCETRWVERHTVLAEFAEMYEPTVVCLEAIGSNSDGTWNSKSLTDANGLLRSICSDQFIAAFQTNLYFSGYTKALSCLLQGSTQDILTAYKEVEIVKKVLKGIRQNAEREFEEAYHSMCKMVQLHDRNELSIPRRCSRQTLRSNVEADTPQAYWRRAVFIPFVDHLLSELSTRFTQLNKKAIQGLLLLPPNLTSLTEAKILEIYEHFNEDLPEPEAFRQEVKLWKERWNCCLTPVPHSLSETLEQVNSKAYPNISTILQLLLVVPVAAATVERGNSALKYVKNELRSTMGQDRLNALILLYVHKDIALDYDAIITSFVSKRPRRMLLQNPLAMD